jgi:integrase
MPRQVRDAALETRAARSRLRVQKKPFFRLIEPGLHLGYRKLASGPGTWVVRKYRGAGAYKVTNLRTPDGRIILADDFAEADGTAILSFSQAQQTARTKPEQSAPEPYTVADAVADYLRFLKSEGRSAYAIQQAKYTTDAFILPVLGKVKLAALTSDRLRHWRDALAEMPNRHVNKISVGNSVDALRARRATVNRKWTTLVAILNRAFREGKVDADISWRKIKPFEATSAARLRYLTIDEARRLINATDPEFRPLVQAALQTGARYGELIRLQVRDFDPDAGTLGITQSKSGKPRHVVLTDEGASFFAQLCAGRRGDEVMLRYDDGRPFGKTMQKWMEMACEHASITPRITFHVLRHTWASLSIMAGVPVMVVARNLGHADTRMVEKHYGHLAASYVTEAIRSGAPRFGAVEPSSVVPIARKLS